MRQSGILTHISSLPSPYGIGTLGKEAYNYVDFLKKAGQSCWQILPIHPTGYGDSPYQALSAFAGNHYFIDLDVLVSRGLLKQEEIGTYWGANPERVDFGLLFERRLSLLYRAYERFIQTTNRDFLEFVSREQHWLSDYALFMALKAEFNYRPWTEWDEPIRLRQPEAIAAYRAKLKYQIAFHYFLQFEFFTQWTALRRYAHKNGISIIGDVPIYVPLDSADVWANPDNFLLDAKGQPVNVAGCPPDAFSEDGQLWGNPLYRWDRMEQDGFAWWIRRLRASGEKYDVVRIDHFRGLESYWSIPFGEATARNGRWIKGPGLALIDAIHAALPELRFIAEDLGFLTPEVIALQKASGFPGMKVLEFAFDAREPSNYLPHTYDKACVCYTGTHDNDTLVTWQETLSKADLAYAKKYLNHHEDESFTWNVIRSGMASCADLFVAQMQDYLELGQSARMNRPGILCADNWVWRLKKEALTDELAEKLRDLTALYGRCPRDAAAH